MKPEKNLGFNASEALRLTSAVAVEAAASLRANGAATALIHEAAVAVAKREIKALNAAAAAAAAGKHVASIYYEFAACAYDVVCDVYADRARRQRSGEADDEENAPTIVNAESAAAIYEAAAACYADGGSPAQVEEAAYAAHAARVRALFKASREQSREVSRHRRKTGPARPSPAAQSAF